MLQLFSANENKESKTSGLEPHVLLIHNTIKYFYVKQRGLQIQIVVSWFNTFSSTPLFFFPFLKLPFSGSLLCQMAYAHSMLSESASTDFSSSRGTGLSTAFKVLLRKKLMTHAVYYSAKQIFYDCLVAIRA